MRSAVSILFILGALMASCLSLLRAMTEEDKRNRIKAWGMFAIVAVASAVARAHGKTEGRWTVEVPGGEVVVDLAGGEAWLTGPAVIVARGHVDLPREEKND